MTESNPSPQSPGEEHLQTVQVPTPPKLATTVYIYPGLISAARSKALTLDCQCPATIYKCLQCLEYGERHAKQSQGEKGLADCSHEDMCSICMDTFHSHDLVRVMPCSSQHMFHSRCILTWFSSNNRCPLCNEVIGNLSKTPTIVSESEHRLGGASRHPGEDWREGLSSNDGNIRAPFHIQQVSTPVGRPPPNQTPRTFHIRQSTATPAGQSVSQVVARRCFSLEFNQNRARRSSLARGLLLEHSVAEEQMRRQQALRSNSAGTSGQSNATDGALPHRPEVHGNRAYSYISHDSVRMDIERII
jgi:hypothetical protein